MVPPGAQCKGRSLSALWAWISTCLWEISSFIHQKVAACLPPLHLAPLHTQSLRTFRAGPSVSVRVDAHRWWEMPLLHLLDAELFRDFEIYIFKYLNILNPKKWKKGSFLEVFNLNLIRFINYSGGRHSFPGPGALNWPCDKSFSSFSQLPASVISSMFRFKPWHCSHPQLLPKIRIVFRLCFLMIKACL